MNLSVKNNLKNFLLIGIYSVILLFSEILYRNIFSIPSLTRYFESYIIIFILVSLFFFSKYRITKFLIAFSIFYVLLLIMSIFKYIKVGSMELIIFNAKRTF